MFNLLNFFACSSPLDKCRKVCRTERVNDCHFEWDYLKPLTKELWPEKEFVQECLLRDVDSTHEWLRPAPMRDFFLIKTIIGA